MKFAYHREIPNRGCEILLKTRSEVDPYTCNEDGVIDLHLVMTSGYQRLCEEKMYCYKPNEPWYAFDGIWLVSSKPDMSDILRLPCEWIARQKGVEVNLISRAEEGQQYVQIDIYGFKNIHSPERLIRFVINRMVHKAKVAL